MSKRKRRVNPQTKKQNLRKDRKTGIRTGEVGQPGLKTSGSFIDETKEEALSPCNRFCTFDDMAEDPSVNFPLNLTTTLVGLAIEEGKYVSSGTRKSKVIADFMNQNIHGMSGMSWSKAVANFNTDIKYGFSLCEIVLRLETKGKYKGSYVLDKLAPRSQKSVLAWKWDKYKRNITDVVQKPLQTIDYVKKEKTKDYAYLGNVYDFASVTTSGMSIDKYPIIPKSSLLHFTYNQTNDNPEGKSALIDCFNPWKEKIIVSKYQIIGIGKDMGGIAKGRAPSELMRRANDLDHLYPEDERELMVFQEQLAGMHNGEDAFYLLSSDLVEGSTNVYEYDVELMKSESSGRHAELSKVINDKITEIYNSFGAGYLILGQGDSTSSYNLSTTGRTVHSFYVESAIKQKVDTLQTQLVRTLLDANDADYDHKDLPKFEYKNPDLLDPEALSKFVQRMMSVDGLTVEAAKHMYKAAGLPTEGLEELFEKRDQEKIQSRAGESQGTSGVGDTQAGGANSSTNLENKQLEKVDEYDGQVIYKDPETLDITFQDKVNDEIN